MDWRQWDPLPVGVRRLQVPGESAAAAAYQGISYCDAIRLAGEGDCLRVMPGSVQVCRWSPVVLGLKKPLSRFESGLAPRLDYPTEGLLLARLDRFPGEPEVVVVRAGRDRLQCMIENLASEHLWDGHENKLDRSALFVMASDRPTPRQGLVGAVNRVLAALAPYARWRALTHWLFRSSAITATWEALISRTMADMSICRNSTVIPLLAGQVNVSFFCSGGVTWGRNRPDHLTSGWPWPLFQVAAGSAGDQSRGPSHG